MSIKKIILISILFVALLALPFAGAADNVTDNVNDDILSSDNFNENLTLSDEMEVSTSPKTFTDLNNLITTNPNSTINLEDDYTFSADTDSAFVNGIPITRPDLTINGNGFTIDGANQARIFEKVTSTYMLFRNINFINGNAEEGGAITGTNYAVISSSFTNNYASKNGGALYGATVNDCTFTGNSAGKLGGAMYKGNAELCTFTNNYAYDGGATYDVYATNSNFISNSAISSCGAMYGSSAGYCTFIENSARDHSGAFGFGYAEGCTFINNTAKQSGAMGGSGQADSCIFRGNYANEGGAMFGCEAYSCTFIENHANQGGAMAGGVQAIDCIFEDNYASKSGGALLEVYALRCNFTGNYANEGGALVGGKGATDCNFINNSAVNGGAIHDAYADTSNFTYNNAKLGGAIYEGYASKSTFRYNSATNGGAIYFPDSSSEYAASACVFISNVAEEYGGALYGTSAGNCYFKSNSAKFGGAISSNSAASGSTFIANIAKVSGGAKFNSYVSGSTFEGNLPDYKLYVSDFSAVEGFGGDLLIKLADNPNYFVDGENVTVKVYNDKAKLVGTYKAQTGYNWFVNLSAGQYRAVISVDEVGYDVDSVKISMIIKKSTSIYVVNITTSYDAGKSLIINLHDSKGNVLKYTKINVNLAGTVKTYKTDDHGQVIISTKGLAPNTYNVAIDYAGDSKYLQSSAVAKIVVKKVNPKLSASAKTFKVKVKTKSYTVTLKTNKNVVMKNTKLTLKVNGKTYSAKTNAKGKATFKITKLTKKGKFNAVITYSGNKIYNKISKKVKITVKK